MQKTTRKFGKGDIIPEESSKWIMTTMVKSSCPSVSQYGSELINQTKFAEMIETATSGYRHGFKKDVEFIHEFPQLIG